MRIGMRYSLTSIKHIVHHEIEARGKVGHIATEGLIRIDGNLQTTQVHTIVGGEKLLYVRILIALHLFRGEALTTEVLECLIANGIHRLWGMRENHLACLLVQLYILLFTIHYSLFTRAKPAYSSPISSLIQS